MDLEEELESCPWKMELELKQLFLILFEPILGFLLGTKNMKF